jgi:hypothetical protein
VRTGAPGLDRHLFALYVVSQGTNIKSEFLNRALSMQWRLSTSQQPQNQTGEWDPRRDANQVSPGGGFGPVTDDGYGVSYMVASDDEVRGAWAEARMRSWECACRLTPLTLPPACARAAPSSSSTSRARSRAKRRMPSGSAASFARPSTTCASSLSESLVPP